MNPFDLQPTLAGRLVRLRPLRAADFEDLYAVASDPLLWEMHPERTRYKREVFERFFTGAMESGGALLALDAGTGAVIGTSRFAGFSPADDHVEIGYTFLSRSCWGKGHNTEMKALMLAHAFRFVGTVRFFIGEQNLRSRRAVEKLGAVLVGRIEDRKPHEGGKYTAMVYALRKPSAPAGER